MGKTFKITDRYSILNFDLLLLIYEQ